MNTFSPVDPNLIDVVLEFDGYVQDEADGVWDACGNAAREFPQALWIEPKDWADKARDNDKYKNWGIDYLDRFTNQSPTHECTNHALRAAAECAANKQQGIKLGPPVAGRRLPISAQSRSIWYSCLYPYAEANPRQWGGASTRGLMDLATRKGLVPDRTQPREYNFRHVLTGTAGRGGINQSNGNWVPLSRFPSGWETTALQHRPLEVIIPRIWEQVVCLLLHGWVVGHGRQGHAVPLAFWNNTSRVAGYPDSYDVIRYDSINNIRAGLVSAYCITSMSIPPEIAI